MFFLQHIMRLTFSIQCFIVFNLTTIPRQNHFYVILSD